MSRSQGRTLQVAVLSDGTGWTAEGVARSLLSQFPAVEPVVRVFGGLRSAAAVRELVERLVAEGFGSATRLYESTAVVEGVIVATFTLPECRQALVASPWPVIDVLGPGLDRLSDWLELPAEGVPGRAHGAGATAAERAVYGRRVAAIEYALAHDDGLRPEGWAQADVLLLGVSRSGKTPTSLALALHQAWFVANLPLVEEDFVDPDAPFWARVARYRDRSIGLTIAPERLAEIRATRKPGSRYASPAQCRAELEAARVAFTKLGVPVIDVTLASIEEIAQRVREISIARRPALAQDRGR